MIIHPRRAAVIMVPMLISTLALAVAYAAGFRVNLTPSYPLGVWRIETLSRAAAVGDRVFICPPRTAAFGLALDRGYLRSGTCDGGFGPLIKSVVALPGQRVDIAAGVLIDGMQMPHSDISAVDASGRSLVPYRGGVVPPDHVFLHSHFAGSYDSRYFGPIPAEGVLGLAREVLTYAP